MRRVVILLALLVISGCGKVTNVREQDLIVQGDAKWKALSEHRRLVAECIDVVKAQYGEADGQAWGSWTAHLTASGAHVKYEAHTGNAAFRDQWGMDVTADVWPDRDGTLTAWNVRKHAPRVLCDQVPDRG